MTAVDVDLVAAANRDNGAVHERSPRGVLGLVERRSHGDGISTIVFPGGTIADCTDPAVLAAMIVPATRLWDVALGLRCVHCGERMYYRRGLAFDAAGRGGGTSTWVHTASDEGWCADGRTHAEPHPLYYRTRHSTTGGRVAS